LLHLMSQWQLHDDGNNTTYLGLFLRIPIVCFILNQMGFSRQTVINAPSVKSHKNAPSENHAVTCGRTDRQGAANRRFVPVCESAVKHVLILSVCCPFLYFACLALLPFLSLFTIFYRISFHITFYLFLPLCFI